MAWSKTSEQAKKATLNTPDNEKGSDSNPAAIVNNHEMIFEDEDKDENTTGDGNPSISAQTHSSSNRSIVASVHQSDPARRTIQANASTLRHTSESKCQEPEERGRLHMATHKTSNSNRQTDANGAFSKAVEKKSTSRVSWDNDIKQPASKRHKKPQLQVNMARWKKVEALEDGALAGLESSDKEEREPGEQTNPRRIVTSTQVTAPPVAAATRSNVHAAARGYNTRRDNTTGGGRGRGRGRGHTPGSHCFGAGGGGQSYRTEAPLLQKTPRWLHPIAPRPIWHAAGGTCMLPLTCCATKMVHTTWMFAKTALLQVLKMTRKAQRETPVPSFHTMSDLIKLLAIMLLLHMLDARLSRVRLETTWTDPRGVRQALLPEPTQHCKYLFEMMEPWPGLNQMKRMVMI